MKTNVEVDESLMAYALQATGLTATDQVNELALTMLINPVPHLLYVALVFILVNLWVSLLGNSLLV